MAIAAEQLLNRTRRKSYDMRLLISNVAKQLFASLLFNCGQYPQTCVLARTMPQAGDLGAPDTTISLEDRHEATTVAEILDRPAPRHGITTPPNTGWRDYAPEFAATLPLYGGGSRPWRTRAAASGTRCRPLKRGRRMARRRSVRGYVRRQAILLPQKGLRVGGGGCGLKLGAAYDTYAHARNLPHLMQFK